MVAVDARRRDAEGSGWEVYTHGGRRPTGLDAVKWCERMESLGAGEILLTSMDRDGTRDGFDLALTRAVSDAVGIPVIASGGVGTLDHLADGVIEGRADAVLAASIFHFGDYTVREAKARLAARGIEVRLGPPRPPPPGSPTASRPGTAPAPAPATGAGNGAGIGGASSRSWREDLPSARPLANRYHVFRHGPGPLPVNRFRSLKVIKVTGPRAVRKRGARGDMSG